MKGGQRRGAGALALALALALPAGPARAEERAATGGDRPAVPGARDANAVDRDALCLRFDGDWSPRLAALIESDLRTAFGRRRVAVCAPDAPAGERAAAPLLTLTLEGETLDRVALTLDPRDAPALERRLNLTPFPADGRVLALVVAADELLQATRERPAETPPAAAPPPPPLAPEHAPTLARSGAPVPQDGRHSLAAGFALERYGGGQTQLGPDLTLRMHVTDTLFVAVAGQARRGLAADATTGTVTSRLLGGRLALGARLYADDDARLTLTADLGVRGARLWFEGEPTAGSAAVGSTAAGWLGYADATLAMDLRLAGRLALRLAAGAGVPLVAQAAAEGTRAVTAASGLALEAQAAVLMVF